MGKLVSICIKTIFSFSARLPAFAFQTVMIG